MIRSRTSSRRRTVEHAPFDAALSFEHLFGSTTGHSIALLEEEIAEVEQKVMDERRLIGPTPFVGAGFDEDRFYEAMEGWKHRLICCDSGKREGRCWLGSVSWHFGRRSVKHDLAIMRVAARPSRQLGANWRDASGTMRCGHPSEITSSLGNLQP